MLLGNKSEAFAIVERARARSLVEMLAERQIDFGSDASTELLEQQRELDRQRAQVYAAISQLNSLEDAEQVTALGSQLHELEHRQQALTAAFRQASPHYASLQYPQSLDLAGVQKVLDTGTLLLSYMLGDDESFLFAITSQSLEVFTLPVCQQELQQQVSAFRQALDVGSLEHSPRQARQLGRALYKLLLAPAYPQIQQAERLLFCPDGPLHVFPFAALPLPGRGKVRYLGQAKPFSITLSMTVYAQTRRQKKPEEIASATHGQSRTPRQRLRARVGDQVEKVKRLLALGDPLYTPLLKQAPVPIGIRSTGTHPEEAPAHETHPPPSRPEESSDVADWVSRGFTLAPLPFSRQEVESIGRLFGEESTLLLGEQATKSAAIQAAPEAQILHFACHGVLDPQMPLRSGLVLSQPEALGERAVEGDNGLLQAWEIFEQVKLEADLVVLSSCQSGLGQEVRGEGLIGLTRAFTYAGARSLLVSLWEIQDESTAAFMEAFYAGLSQGQNKAEALQAAIVTLSKHPQWSEPFYWSAFLLTGDWQ